MRLGLQALLRPLFDSGFNHTGDTPMSASGFSISKGIDRRISTVKAWEEASVKDPLFVLEVPWMPVDRSIPEVIERIRTRRSPARRPVTDADQIARMIFNLARLRPTRS